MLLVFITSHVARDSHSASVCMHRLFGLACGCLHLNKIAYDRARSHEWNRKRNIFLDIKLARTKREKHTEFLCYGFLLSSASLGFVSCNIRVYRFQANLDCTRDWTWANVWVMAGLAWLFYLAFQNQSKNSPRTFQRTTVDIDYTIRYWMDHVHWNRLRFARRLLCCTILDRSHF